MADYVRGDKRVIRDSVVLGDRVLDGEEVLQMDPESFSRMDPEERMATEAWLEGQEERGKKTLATRFVKKRLARD